MGWMVENWTKKYYGVINTSKSFSWYKPSSEIESYMLHQGEKFTERFDANSYLRLLDAWQKFDLVTESNSIDELDAFKNSTDQKYLIFSSFFVDQHSSSDK